MNRNKSRLRRKIRIRKKIEGTLERPRLCVFRSNRHIEAQLIDDGQGHTLLSASTREKDQNIPEASTIAAAKEVGRLIAERAIAQNIEAVVFDRGGYQFHGRVAELANAARESGLKF